MATRGGREARRGRGGRFRGDPDDRNRSRGRSRGRGRGNSNLRGENRGGRDRGRGGSRGVHRPPGYYEETDNNDSRSEDMLQLNARAARRIWSLEHIKRLAATKGNEIVGIVFNDQAAFFNVLQDQQTMQKFFKLRLVI